MFFSIIIPTFNSSATIHKALTSIVSQTYSDVEILIIDGNSQDNTVEIIRNFALEHSNLKWISEKDNGVYDAMNKGIKMAKGEWLYFLGSDDYLYNENVLAEVSSSITSNKNSYHLIYGNVFSPFLGGKYDGCFDVLKITKKNICHQAIFYNKSIFTLLGNFKLKYKILADWDINLRCFLNPDVRINYIDLTIAFYSQDGISSQNVDVLFYKNKDSIITENGYKTLPLKTLKYHCRSNVEFFLFYMKRILSKTFS